MNLVIKGQLGIIKYDIGQIDLKNVYSWMKLVKHIGENKIRYGNGHINIKKVQVAMKTIIQTSMKHNQLWKWSYRSIKTKIRYEPNL